MPRPHATTPTQQETLHAWVDNRLTPEQRALHLTNADNDTRATAEAWRDQRIALQALHADVLQEPIPAAMLEVATKASSHRARAANQMRWAGVAASVVLAFGMGWIGRGQMPGGESVSAARSPVQAEFVRAAGYAHAVYLPEKRHPVEVGAAEQEHLVQWLSKRLGRTLRVPDLGQQGYALVGGRLLPGEGSARAQFMFEDPQGHRVTLYMGGVTQPDAHPTLAETRFQFESNKGTSSFYWFDRDFGYALSGQVEREVLMALATQVYGQLEKQP
jgi:anti-sigma factor RsiW